jgi:HSP20 family protein
MERRTDERTNETQAKRTPGSIEKDEPTGAIEHQGSTRGRMTREGERKGNPFGLVSRMMSDMERWFGGFGGDLLSWNGREALGGMWNPQIEVRERDGRLVVTADLPGMKPEEVEVHVEDDVLTLKGERRSQHEDQREGVYHCERSYGRFERSIALPPGIDPNAIDARFENGVLEISTKLPEQRARGRRIDVKGTTDTTTTKPAEAKKPSTSH